MPKKKRNDAPLRHNYAAAKESKPISLSKQLSNKTINVNSKSSKKFEKKKPLRETIIKPPKIDDSDDSDDLFEFQKKKPVTERGNINARQSKNVDAMLSKIRKQRNRPMRLQILESNSESSENYESSNSSSGGNSVIRVVNIPSKVLSTRQLRELL